MRPRKVDIQTGPFTLSNLFSTFFTPSFDIYHFENLDFYSKSVLKVWPISAVRNVPTPSMKPW